MKMFMRRKMSVMVFFKESSELIMLKLLKTNQIK